MRQEAVPVEGGRSQPSTFSGRHRGRSVGRSHSLSLPLSLEVSKARASCGQSEEMRKSRKHEREREPAGHCIPFSPSEAAASAALHKKVRKKVVCPSVTSLSLSSFFSPDISNSWSRRSSPRGDGHGREGLGRVPPNYPTRPRERFCLQPIDLTCTSFAIAGEDGGWIE